MESRAPTPDVPALSEIPTSLHLSSGPSSQSPTPLVSPSSKVVQSIPSPSRSPQFIVREISVPVLPQTICQPGMSPSDVYNKGLDDPNMPSSVSVSVQNAVIVSDEDSSNVPPVLLPSLDCATSIPSSKAHLPVSPSQTQPIVSSVTTTMKSLYVPVIPVTTVSNTTTVTKPSVSPSRPSRRKHQSDLLSPVSKESFVFDVPVVTSTTTVVCCTGHSSVVTCSSVTSVAKSTFTTSVTTAMKSPVSTTSSPFTTRSKASPSPLHSPLQQVPENKLDSSTVDTSAIQPKEVGGGTTKRIPIYMQDKIQKTITSPIYMQEPKSRITLEKKSPRSQATSPRWRDQKESTKSKEKKGSTKYNRHGGGKGGRGRGSTKGAKGKNFRFNSVSVPKELQGTVYDFDDEFDDDLSPAAPCSLNDLRTMREKRHSVDTKPSPQQPSSTPIYSSDRKTTPTYSSDRKTTPTYSSDRKTTPTYSSDQKESSSSKKGNKKSKASSKEKSIKSSISSEQNSIDVPLQDNRSNTHASPRSAPRRVVHQPEVEVVEEDEDEVAKILADYRNQQNSKLGRGSSTHEPSPHHIDEPTETIAPHPKSPAISLDKQFPDYSTNIGDSKSVIVEDREIIDIIKPISDLSSKIGLTVSTVQGPDERQNQLKLKIKGPYARLSNIVAPSLPPETAAAPSQTSCLRGIRMYKKELIRQYCQIEDAPEPNPPPQHSNTTSNPPHVRQTISIPKAVKSMPSIPTREDYKMYTQQEDHNVPVSGSRRRPKRESRDTRKLDNTGIKRNNDSDSVDVNRKRQRGSKESRTHKDKDKEIFNAKPPPKLRISLGKKGSEVTTVPVPEIRQPERETRQQSMADNTRQQKPIKKRVPEEDPITKIMNDNLKFREQIMAEFSKPGKKEKQTKEERKEERKKSKKRKVDAIHSLTVAIKEENEEQPDIKVLNSESTNVAPKLVIKFGKGKAKDKSEHKEMNSLDSSEMKTESVFKAQPLKLRLSLPRITVPKTEDESKNIKVDSEGANMKKEIPKLKIGALKLKLSRRSDGYVASNSPRHIVSNFPIIPHSKAQDQGPGPPDLFPPMQPQPAQVPSLSKSSSVNELSSGVPTYPSLPSQVHTSPHQDNNPKQTSTTGLPDNASSRGAGVPSGAPVPSGATYPSSGPVLGGAPYEMMGHSGFQNDIGFNSGTEPPSCNSPAVGVGGGGPLGSQAQPYPDDDVMRRLEAQLAASDGPATSPTHPSAPLHPPPPTLPEVPSLHHTLYNSQKEDNDCR